MNEPRVFDETQYESYNAARETVVRKALADVGAQSPLSTCLDVGCGVGYFSAFLISLGLHVTGVDGRAENAEEAARRVPQASFQTANVEDAQLAKLGCFDVVLCFGLLYHLENPFCAIRNLYRLTGKVLLVESMCAPGNEPSMQLLDEFHGEDQGLNYIAFYPTESCLVKMLYRAGFPYVFAFVTPPDHVDFRATKRRKKARTMLLASNVRLNTQTLALIEEPVRPWDIWSAPLKPWRLRLGRVANSGRKLAAHFWGNNQNAGKVK